MSGPNELLVEGSDDLHVIRNLLLVVGHRLEERDHKVIDKQGVENLLDAIPVMLKDVERRVLAVVLDADEDVSARWQAVCARVRRAIPDAVLPLTPDPAGTVVFLPDGRRFGAWLMPDNQLGGMLEDFLKLLVPSTDLLFEHADTFVGGIPVGARLFGAKEAKAKLHAWLAVQADPGRPLGVAVTARVLDPSRPSAAAFVEWLRRAWLAPAEG